MIMEVFNTGVKQYTASECLKLTESKEYSHERCAAKPILFMLFTIQLHVFLTIYLCALVKARIYFITVWLI